MPVHRTQRGFVSEEARQHRRNVQAAYLCDLVALVQEWKPHWQHPIVVGVRQGHAAVQLAADSRFSFFSSFPFSFPLNSDRLPGSPDFRSNRRARVCVLSQSQPPPILSRPAPSPLPWSLDAASPDYTLTHRRAAFKSVDSPMAISASNPKTEREK